jgi:ribosomal protein S7
MIQQGEQIVIKRGKKKVAEKVVDEGLDVVDEMVVDEEKDVEMKD